MRKVIFTCALVLAGSLSALFAQYNITGRVTDASGNPVANASVAEKGSDRGAVTDQNGYYRLNASKQNPTLSISIVGYKTQELTASSAEANVQLQPGTDALQNITVVGSRSYGRSALNTPVPVDVIPLQRVINTIGQLDINQLLQFAIPSFNSNRQTGSDGADHVDPASLRGLGPDQTLVLLNGKRYHQSSLVNLFGTRGRGNTGTDLNTIPASAIERIEVLRDGAAAQYGSDAIAGVINIVLKSNTGQLAGNLSGGLTGQGDGLNTVAGLNYGIKVKENGFINLTGEYNYRGRTNRSDYARPPYTLDVPRRYFGDALLHNIGSMLNASIPISKSTAFYANGGYNYRYGNAYAWSRQAGDLGRNISSIYPAGYDPQITSRINDLTGTVGLKGAIKDWNWDLSTGFGSNEFTYVIQKTLNASWGPTSPTSFNAGGFSLAQQISSLNVTRFFPNWLPAGTNLAFGAEFRAERYKIKAGEDASWKNYGAFQNDDSGSPVYGASGSQGFPGFQPGDAVNATRNNVGAYADMEFNFSKQLMLEAAGRFEHYSDFGATWNGKLAARYSISPAFTLRGSISTGFRAPSLAQVNFSSTYTNFEGGVAKEIQLARNGSALTNAIGIPALKQERSLNGSFGFTSRPAKGLTLTVDGYYVKIKDRIVLTGDFDSSNTPSIAPILNQLNVAVAKFFTNAVDTKTMGIDAVLGYNHNWGSNSVTATLAANVNRLTFGTIKTAGQLAGKEPIYFSSREQSFVKASAPPSKVSLTLMDKIDRLNLLLRFTRFDKIELENYNGVLDVYKPKITTDVSANFEVSRKLQWTLGANNVFNVYPNRSVDMFNTESGGPFDPVQMGIGGSFFYTKLYFRL